MSDNTQQDDKLKEQIADILKKQADEKKAKAEETAKNISDAQKAGPDKDQARRHPIYRTF
jgi:hypothetical protein